MVYTRYNCPYTVSPDTNREELAREISAVIMDEYEPKMIERSIEMNYSFLDKCEIDEIEKIARRIEWEGESGDYPPFARREALVRERLEDFLATEGSVHPKGFADFRVKELSVYAEAMASEAAERYFEEREYEEFAYLLRMFVSSRRSSEKVVHVVWDGGDIRLYNRFKRDITKKYEADFYEASSRNGAKEEDMAISAIIAAAPEKLVLHSPPEGSPLAKTLEKIFEDSCEVCRGCSLCRETYSEKS